MDAVFYDGKAQVHFPLRRAINPLLHPKSQKIAFYSMLAEKYLVYLILKIK